MIALPATIEDHTSDVSIYGSVIRRPSAVELLCVGSDEIPPIATSDLTVITFICCTYDNEIMVTGVA